MGDGFKKNKLIKNSWAAGCEDKFASLPAERWAGRRLDRA